MAIEMIMPKVDMDQETGTIADWLKQEGDEVKEGEIILVIETDKVAIDIESPGSGILSGISAKKGDVLPIGTVIAYVLEPGEEQPKSTASTAPAAPQAEAPRAALPASAAQVGTVSVMATPVAQKMAAANQIDLSSVAGTGHDGKITKEDVTAAIEAQTKPGGDGKVYAAPAARRTARERGVDLSQVPGTGPLGRIQGFDVEAYSSSPAAGSGLIAGKGTEPDVIPLIGMRRTIAERMTASYQSIPHIKFTSSVDMTKFIAARKELNARAENRGEPKVSATALIVKLVAAALRDHPWMNSSITEDSILLHKEVNIGVAVALESGLIVPVVKNADLKVISQIAGEVTDLAMRAREGQLVSSEVKGGTFTISNLGPFGVEQFDAIINPPEAAILAIAATLQQAVPQADGQIVSRPMMRFSLSADHRIVDGAVAARFVADLKAVFENPILVNY